MGKRYLIDTNVIVEYLSQSLPTEISKKISSIVDQEFNISFINKIEVLVFVGASRQEQEFIGFANLYYIDDNVINRTIELRTNHKIKLPDAIIAATAISNDLILLTRNIADFKNIRQLRIQNPWDWAK